LHHHRSLSRSERTGTTYNAGFIAIKLTFGRYRRGSEAAAALVDASVAGPLRRYTPVSQRWRTN
jgi:hypothetical protein